MLHQPAQPGEPASDVALFTVAPFLLIPNTCPIEKLLVRPDPNMEAIAAELTTLLRATVGAADDTGLGPLQELAVTTERMTTVLVAITPEYFLFASLTPGAVMGRARFALRLAGLALVREFE